MTHPVGGGDAGDGGEDLGAVADRAGAPGTPNTDVVKLTETIQFGAWPVVRLNGLPGKVDVGPEGDGGGAGVPVEAGDGAGTGGEVLQTVLARHHHVPALVLGNL